VKFDDVLVVGGAGFIGRHLVAALAARGIRVTVPSRRRESAKHLILLPTVDVIEADVMARGALERLAAGRQAVINLVGTLHGPNFSRVHVELPQAIVNACRAVGVKRLLHVSALGASPSAPKLAPMRRTCWPARSPKAMRCCTEAARVRASSGASSTRGS